MYWITGVALLFAMNGSLQLSLQDWKKKDVCPKMLGIPVCYIVFTFFLGAAICHAFPSGLTNSVYFALVSVPGLIALSGTVMELMGRIVCPRTSGGVPMCYISLAMCLVLIVTKLLSL